MSDVRNYRFRDWVQNLNPTDLLLYNPFAPTCLEWKRHAPRRPIRGRLFRAIAWLISWRTEQIFSNEFMESWEVRAEVDLARKTCVRWQPAKISMKPLDSRKITFGPANVADEADYVSVWAAKEDKE